MNNHEEKKAFLLKVLDKLQSDVISETQSVSAIERVYTNDMLRFIKNSRDSINNGNLNINIDAMPRREAYFSKIPNESTNAISKRGLLDKLHEYQSFLHQEKYDARTENHNKEM